LKATGNLGEEIEVFLKEKNYSPFREEVGIQFLEFIVANHSPGLPAAIAFFELALIKIKLGYQIETTVEWKYEPYSIIDALLNDGFSDETLQQGNYLITISNRLEAPYFEVVELA